MDLTAVLVFAGALLLNSGTPGPSIAALVSRVVTNGWREVTPFVAAMWIGEVIWLTTAMAGLSALAQAFQPAFLVLKWLGVAYLFWLAVKTWKQPAEVGEGAPLPHRRTRSSMFGAGMALTLGNPKIMVFYVALLPSLVDLTAHRLAQWAVLAPVTLVVLAGVDVAWILLAHRARALLRTRRAVRFANRAGAAALGGAAVVVAARG